MNKVSMKNHWKIELVLNFDTVSARAINKLDKSFIGTDHYMGQAYFWDHEVKWWLRDATPFQRVKVHKLFMANNIPFNKKDKYFTSNKLAEEICKKVCEGK